MRQAIRWGLRHGVLRQAARRRVQAGDVLSRLMIVPEAIADPYPEYDALRAKGRLVPGIVMGTAHHDVSTAILRSPDFGVIGGTGGQTPAAFALAMRLGGRGPLSAIDPPSMLAVDPPDHTRYRKLVTRAFSARAVAALRTRAEEVAAELLDGMGRRPDRADLIEDYAGLLPATIIAEVLGAPVEMRRQLLKWGAGAARLLDAGLTLREFMAAEGELAAMQRWMTGHLEHLRREPGDNVLSALVHSQSAEGRLTEDELTSTALLVLAAGFETTVNLIGNGAALLTAHPQQLEVLRSEPARWTNAVDEVLRHDSPVQRTGRIAHRDTTVAGEPVRAGTAIVIQLGGANRDPAVFADPNRFDITRANAADHVAFSSGIHYCIGAGLARMEGEVGLRALFDRFPDLAPTAPPHRRPTRVLRGFDAMPVRLCPSRS